MIPDYLTTQIREGKAVLLLGAGASLEAVASDGTHPPTGRQLGKMLSSRFLGGKYADAPLNQIGEYAVSEADLLTVQQYICEIFSPFQPTPAHQLLPTFRWFGIATTNYDLLVERAYQTHPGSLQVPAVFVDNSDRFADRLRDAKYVPYLKLHGCITRLNNSDCPLILTTDQYIQHKKGRDRLFNILKDWGLEHTFVFIGHSLQDPDIRAILLELACLGDTRPRYYVVAPDVDEIQRRFWESRYKVTPIAATFSEFFSQLDAQLSSPFRSLAATGMDDATAYPISERFATRDWALSAACKQFLTTDVTYVKAVQKTEMLSATDFYRGMNKEWSAIEAGLDVRRRLADTILSEHFLALESSHSDAPELILIKAHAGAGKSVMLRRIAWDAAKEYNCLCLWLNSHGVVSSAPIQELISLCRERIYLFVDNAGDRIRDILNVVRHVGDAAKLLTIVTAERINEWNVSCSPLSAHVSHEYELRYLSEPEVDALLSLLESHRALGTLTGLPVDERRRAFVERAGRQLLVALHEATLGRPFEDIVINEYESIAPHDAQHMYLTICVLNRLGVPIRANLIAHIHGIRYEDFRERLFQPLEHVVLAKYDPVQRDYLYRARHQHIAEIVFERVLHRAEDRFDAYIRCLQYLNDVYEVDRKAIRQMLRGRSLLDVLGSHELIDRIYAAAQERFGDSAFLCHQMALYEMHRPNGNFRKAGELLTLAAEQAPSDMTIRHSMAEYYLKAADAAKSELEQKHCLREAASLCSRLKDRIEEDSYAYHTLAKIGLRELQFALERDNERDSVLEDMLKKLQENLSEGLQRFPGDSHLLSADAELASCLADSERARQSLEKAFNANPRNGFIAIRLSRVYEDKGKHDKAKDVLRRAIESHRSDKRLHFAYAQLLLGEDEYPNDEVIYHLQRSFSPGDSNYRARLLLGRQLYIEGRLVECSEVFKELGRSRVSPNVRNAVQEPLEVRCGGKVSRIEATYCFIVRDGINDWVFTHCDNVDDAVWRQLTVDTRVRFRIGFTFRGASAFDVELQKVQ